MQKPILPNDYDLVMNNGCLSLKKNNSPFKPIFVDFLNGKNKYRAEQSGGRQQDIARAVGVGSHMRPNIIDATAGLGSDAFALASLKCKVTMLERSPILHALLADGLARAKQNPHFTGELSLIHTDATEYLNNLHAHHWPDVIYIDPMFPSRTKSALVKKEMRLCRELVGDDLDAPELLHIALQRAKKRVIVKRPRLAQTLGDQKPSLQITGKTMRFDVYIKNLP